jgi:NitT/TauT family transport system substrate-binding protein
MMGFLVSADAEPGDLERYYRALRRAQAELDLEPERYKRHWLAEMPDDLSEAADVRRFGTGERIVFEPYTREMFERTHRWMERWQLIDAPPAERASYEQAILA